MSKFETERLIIRKFTADDGEGLREYALYKEGTGFEEWENWPTDLEGCNKLAEHLVETDKYWAVIRKSDSQFIGYISFNKVDDDKNLDLGHRFIPKYNEKEEAVEALEKMVQYAFDSLNIDAVDTRNPRKWKEQVAPLQKLDFTQVEEDRMQMTRKKWHCRTK